MSIVNITDEADSSKTATVFADKSLKTESRFSYYLLPSGTATAAILSNSGFLHAIVCTVSAATTSLQFFNSTTAGAIGTSASAIAIFDSLTRGTLIFDAILGSGLTYRLSAADAAGVVVVYSTWN